jgi:hypothetical protein
VARHHSDRSSHDDHSTAAGGATARAPAQGGKDPDDRLCSRSSSGKGEAPTASREGGQAAAKALNTSPPPITDGVDKLYRQLAEIHAIAAAQLAGCAHWRHSDSTPSLVRGRTGRQRPDEMPSVIRMAPPPPTDFSPQTSLWQQGPHVEHSAHRQARQLGVGAHKTPIPYTNISSKCMT